MTEEESKAIIEDVTEADEHEDHEENDAQEGKIFILFFCKKNNVLEMFTFRFVYLLSFLQQLRVSLLKEKATIVT
jgi:hypothetical protein